MVWFVGIFFYVDMFVFFRIENEAGVTIVFDCMFGCFLSNILSVWTIGVPDYILELKKADNLFLGLI